MLDRMMLKLTRPAVDLAAQRLAKLGWTANQVTFASFGLGAVAAGLIACGYTWLALFPLLGGRILDGVDGAVARLNTPTDRGAFIDIGLDFVFYAAVPLSFGILNPAANALAAAVLLAAFVSTGTTFLAYAIMAEKRGLKNDAYPNKSFYYLGGLAEGTETVLCFVLMCLWPEHFAVFAYVYALLCAITTATRLAAGWSAFDGSEH
jgi:phosphatidylglycerophosphate synthase